MSISSRHDYIIQLNEEIATIQNSIAELQGRLEISTANALVPTILQNSANQDELTKAQTTTKKMKDDNQRKLMRLTNHTSTQTPTQNTNKNTEIDESTAKIIHAAQKRKIQAEKSKPESQTEKEKLTDELTKAQEELSAKTTSLKNINLEMNDHLNSLLRASEAYTNHLSKNNCWWTILNICTLCCATLIFFKHDKSEKLTEQTKLTNIFTLDGKSDAEKLDLFEKTMKESKTTLSTRRARTFFSSIYDGALTLFGYQEGQSQGKEFCETAEKILAKKISTP